jgi:predicted Rossmann-fold nucleotide-binding protein
VERGFDALRDIENGVSVFGSARVPEGPRWYELGRETGGLSVGLNIQLPHEQGLNPTSTAASSSTTSSPAS